MLSPQGVPDGLELESGLDEHHDGQRRVGGHVPADEGDLGGERLALGSGEAELRVGGVLIEDLDIPFADDARRGGNRRDGDA